MRARRSKPRRLLAAILLALTLVAVSSTFTQNRINSAQAASPVQMLYGSAPDIPDRQLQSIVEDAVGNLPGTWGVAVKKLDTGQFASYNGDVQQVSASLYKLWVMAELYHQVSNGQLALDDDATVTGDDQYYDASTTGAAFDIGTTLTLRRAADAMITYSDNTAAALLVRILGPDNINAFMQQNGLDQSVLDWSGVGDNMTTPLDMMHFLELIATSRMVDAESSSEMVDMMLDQQINNRLPVDLPEEARVAHKTGDLDSLLHDVGIIYGPSGPFVIVVMSSNLDTLTDGFDNMALLARRVYDYFNSQPSSPARYFPETRETVGHDFLKFWNDYGGLSTFGFPISPEQVHNGLLVQQFERARFELHTDNAVAGGPEPMVVLGLVGQERAAQMGLSWPDSKSDGTGIYFDSTHQELSGDFLYFWQNHGGERVFGWPISPAQAMVNPTDGKTYLTQWFQRARLEYHPDLPVRQRIVLGALGTEIANSP